MGWREEPPTLEEALKKVHSLSLEASWMRKKVVKAMSEARHLGASFEELSHVSGLSLKAVRTLLRRYPGAHPADPRPR